MQITTTARDGSTLAEVLISVLICAIFFSAIFEVNAICLRYVDATKETVSAIQTANDRVEILRNIAFSDLLTQSYMTTTIGIDTAGNPLPGNGTPAPGLLVSPADSSTFSSVIGETITLTDFTTGSAGTVSVAYTRAAGSSSTPTVAWSGGASFPSATKMVKANVTVNWTSTFGGRARSEKLETIISAGTKK